MNTLDCINSQCGASAGDCGCAARVREAAVFLDRMAAVLAGRSDPEDKRNAAASRAMAAKLRGGGDTAR